MAGMEKSIKKGIGYAFLTALLFGVGTPLTKTLLDDCDSIILGGLLLLGSGIGLAIFSLLKNVFSSQRKIHKPFTRNEWGWMFASICCGGVIAPISLLVGLSSTTGSTASLLLNFEAVFTALLAWFVFKESFNRRIIVGMIAIVSGGILLTWEAHNHYEFSLQSLGVIAACMGWALDNNFTRKISNADSIQIAKYKGLISGVFSLALGMFMGMKMPHWALITQASVLGFFSYGVSMVFFVLALRYLGASRASAYFSTAPFIGFIFSILILKEDPPILFWFAAGIMGFGVLLYLTEKHEHPGSLTKDDGS
jgi:drug/metabolite transporter (DMT)-like permease